MSTLKVINVIHPSGSTNNIVTDSSGNVIFGGTAAMASSYLRNRIINGDMRIDQRNAGASVTLSDSTITYGVDRFLAYESTSASSCTVQQVSDGPTSATNGVVFPNSLKFTVGTGGTATASQLAIIEQRIEGYNVSDFGYGSTSALTTTLRFWVKSSVTGTFAVGLRNANDTRSYVTTYTISSANTWEQKTITITGDTTGTWNTTNGSGLQIRWDLGSGSTYQTSTLDAWQSGLYFSTSGRANLIGTSSATFFITGVQLEVGSVATPFERRQYGQELALCQRYFARLGSLSGNYVGFGAGMCDTTSTGFIYIKYPVTMRGTPALSQSNTCIYSTTATFATSSLGTVYYGGDSLAANVNVTGTMTAGRGAMLIGNNNASAYIDLSAEL